MLFSTFPSPIGAKRFGLRALRFWCLSVLALWKGAEFPTDHTAASAVGWALPAASYSFAEKVEVHGLAVGVPTGHTTTNKRRKMSKPYGYESRWVMSSVGVAENGVVTEVGGFRAGTVHAMQFDRVEGCAVFPSIGAWVAAMDAETARRAPWACTLGPGAARAKRGHKLSSIGDRSSAVWVQSKGHYMEVRRGDQTKFSAAERRYWLSVEEWVASLAPPPAVPAAVAEVTMSITEKPADEEEKRHIKRMNELMGRLTSIKGTRGRSAQADVAIELMEYFLTCKDFCDKYPIFRSVVIAKCNQFKGVDSIEFPALGAACDKVLRMLGELETAEKKQEAVVLAAPAPVPVLVVEAKPAFDAVKYHADYMSIKEWVLKQEGMNRNAGIIQLCQYLLDTRTAAADWLAGNSPWRYTSRALIQALGLKADHKEAKEAVDRFLEKF